MSKRNYIYDLLKTVGMILILLAHCQNKPIILDYLRNFEVILLVTVSAMLSYEKYSELIQWDSMIKRNIVKRLKRLIIPTWFFLFVFFTIIYVVTKFRGVSFPYTKSVMVESFLMINGIGYVWIMLVYCWITIGLPILFIIFNRLNISGNVKTIVLACLFFAYKICSSALLNCQDSLSYYTKNTLLYFLGYSLISFLPYALKNYVNITYLKQGILFVFIHLLLFLRAVILRKSPAQLIAVSKYPPLIYYYSFGLGISLVLYSLLSHIIIRENSVYAKIVSMFGKHSQWIYFNHIFAIYIYNEILGDWNWYMMFLFILCIALLLLAIERAFVLLVKRTKWKGLRTVFSLLLGEQI